MLREVDLFEMQKFNGFYVYIHAEKNIMTDLFYRLGAYD